jgi:hypothetical protein
MPIRHPTQAPPCLLSPFLKPHLPLDLVPAPVPALVQAKDTEADLALAKEKEMYLVQKTAHKTAQMGTAQAKALAQEE